MPVKVVDASALAAMLFGEAEAGQIADRLRGSSLFATIILPFEIANVCLVKIRRSPSLRDILLSGFSTYDEMAIELVYIDQTEMLTTAEAFGLTSYDASYLCLAMRLGTELVTLDRRLEAAAKEYRRP